MLVMLREFIKDDAQLKEEMRKILSDYVRYDNVKLDDFPMLSYLSINDNKEIMGVFLVNKIKTHLDNIEFIIKDNSHKAMKDFLLFIDKIIRYDIEAQSFTIRIAEENIRAWKIAMKLSKKFDCKLVNLKRENLNNKFVRVYDFVKNK